MTWEQTILIFKMRKNNHQLQRYQLEIRCIGSSATTESVNSFRLSSIFEISKIREVILLATAVEVTADRTIREAGCRLQHLHPTHVMGHLYLPSPARPLSADYGDRLPLPRQNTHIPRENNHTWTVPYATDMSHPQWQLKPLINDLTLLIVAHRTGHHQPNTWADGSNRTCGTACGWDPDDESLRQLRSGWMAHTKMAACSRKAWAQYDFGVYGRIGFIIVIVCKTL